MSATVPGGAFASGAPIAVELSKAASTLIPHRVRHYVYVAPGELVPRESGMRGAWPCEAKCSCGWETRTGGATYGYIEKAVRDHKWDVANGFWSPDYEALALAAEARIQPATTQDEREHWQRLADRYWGLA